MFRVETAHGIFELGSLCDIGYWPWLSDKEYRLCVLPLGGCMPEDDVWVNLLLYLRHDPRWCLTVANWRLPGGDWTFGPVPDRDIAEEDNDQVVRVRDATDLVQLISDRVLLRRQHRRWIGKCPFHDGGDDSLSVNPDDGFYYCSGCHTSGDAITFVRITERLDFAGAVRLLARRAGIDLHGAPGP